MEMIEATPPGLYEAVISEVGEDTANRDLVDGKYLFRLEPRTLDDIRAFGANSPEDDKRFAAVARLSEINLGLYRTFAEPWIRASVTEPMAEATRAMHPNRLRFELFSDKNPFMSAIKPIAEQVRASRKPVSADNPLLAAEKQASSWIVAALENGGKIRDAMTEAFFLTTYGSPLLQAMVGLGSPSDQTPHRIERDLVREAAEAERRAGLDRKFEQGGVEEAFLRALIHVRRPEGGIRRAGLPDAESHPRDAEVERAAEHPAIPADAERAAPTRAAGRGARDRRACRNFCRPARPKPPPRSMRCASSSARRARWTRMASAALRGSRNCSARSRRRRGKAMVDAPRDAATTRHERYERLIAAAQAQAAIKVAVAHPCDELSLRGAAEAMRLRLIDPILVGPVGRIRHVADEIGFDLAGVELVDADHSHASAGKAVEQVRAGRAEALMKGSLHTDELMGAVVSRESGIRTERRISHCFIMDVPGHPEPLIVTDAAVNIAPDLEAKVNIVQNAIDLAHAMGIEQVRVAILSAMETVTTKVPSTIEAAALCKMAERGQITGALLDGPLALDNAISPAAAAIKKIASPVAGRANILVVPDLEAGNMLAKSLSFLAMADAAGIVLGARVPVILTSRADSVLSRLASCAVAAMVAAARRKATAVSIR